MVSPSNSESTQNPTTRLRRWSKSIDLPKIQFNGFNSLISLALKKLQTKYNLQSHQLDVKNFKIDLTGPEKNIDQVIDQLNHTFLAYT
jgi:hypothetical protein